MENQEDQQEIQNEEIQQNEDVNLENDYQQGNSKDDPIDNPSIVPPSVKTEDPKQEDIDIETKKDNFRKYLEEKGMMNLLTKLLVELYERNDRPVGSEASFEYCSRFFSKLEGYDINVVNSEIEQNKEKLKELEAKFDELDKELNGTDQ